MKREPRVFVCPKCEWAHVSVVLGNPLMRWTGQDRVRLRSEALAEIERIAGGGND